MSAFDDLLADSPAPAPAPRGAAAKPSAFDALLGESVTATPAPSPAPTTPPKSTARRRVNAAVAGTADLLDLGLVGLPAMAVGVSADIANRLKGLIDGRSRTETLADSEMITKTIQEAAGTPIRTLLTNLGAIDQTDTTAISQVMEKAGSILEKAGEDIEVKTGGIVRKQDFLSTVNATFAGLAGRGAQIGAQKYAEGAKAKVLEQATREMLAKAEADSALSAPDRAAAEAAAASRVQAQTDLEGLAVDRARRNVVKRREPSSAHAESAETARLKAEVDAAYVKGAGAAGAPPQELLNALAASQLRDLEASRRAREFYQQGRPPARQPNPAPPNETLTSAIDKQATGRAFDLTAEERIALRGMRQRLDPKTATAIALGATGLGLAMAFEADPTETALAIGGGALIGRAGPGLTLEALRTMPDAAPLGSILNQSAYSLSTLEMLPQNRFEFSKASIEQLLKRPEVTKAERDVLAPILAETPGETITAKQLMEQVKLRTQDFELRAKASDDFADYGLEAIDRKAAAEYNGFRPEDLVRAEPAFTGDDWVVFDRYGDASLNIPRSQAATAEQAIEAARQRVREGEQAAASATTTIYQSPIQLGDNNHFGDPNYFAHTRSFEEGGVKHVVEMQSDLAQRGTTRTSPEELAALEQEFRKTENYHRTLDAYITARNNGNPVPAAVQEQAAAAISFFLPEYSVAQARTFVAGDRQPPRQLGLAYRRGDVLLSEIGSKLRSSNAERVQPMLKNWHKRLVREELAATARKQAETRSLIAAKQAEVANLERIVADAAKPAAWVGDKARNLENVAYDLDVLAMDVRKGHVKESTARQYMLQQEAQFSPEARKRWEEYYTENADETEGFLRPGKGEEGNWGAAYASNFPKVMADFLKKELGKRDVSPYKELIDGYKEDIARLEKQNKVVRFATADTVAKVEGWPKVDVAEDAARAAGRARRTLQMAFDGLAFYKTQAAAALEDADLDVRPTMKAAQEAEIARRQETIDTLQREVTDLEKREIELQDTPAAFRPEHQGIYDRYAGDVTKFLKQLGGKEVTDSAGHTWIEVPVEGTPKMRAGNRVLQFGQIDPKLAAAVTAIGAGTLLALHLSDKENRLGNAAATAAFIGFSFWAASKSPAIAEIALQAVRGAEGVFGNVSAEMRTISQPVLRRLTNHALDELANTYKYMQRVGPFIEMLATVPESAKAKVNAAVLTGRREDIIRAFAAAGKPGLIPEWEKARSALADLGKGLVDSGRLKTLLPDYYPRIVTDLEGLKNYLGQEYRTGLEEALAKAERDSFAKRGEPLSALDISIVTNKHIEGLMRSSGPGKAGFLKERKLDTVSEEMAKFYAPAVESLPIYVSSVVREIERAKFFGKNLVRKDGVTAIDASIGNVVSGEIAAGRMKPENYSRAVELLRSRFGPGEQGTNRLMSSLRDVGYMALLGNVLSALQNLADIPGMAFIHGVIPTAKAAVASTGKPGWKITAADLGMAKYLGEEYVTRGQANPLTVMGVRLSTADAVRTVFKWSGFQVLDTAMKETKANAAMLDYQAKARTPRGQAQIEKRYGEYFGSDLPQLLADLRAGEKTRLVYELAFRELSDAQPTTRIEVPKFYLDNPNLRPLWMLKSFSIKQLNLLRERGFREIAKGNVGEGTKFLVGYGIALGLGGATMEFIANALLGRDDKLEWGDIPVNALKSFGLSQFVVDKFRQGKPGEAAASALLPPVGIAGDIINPRTLRDPDTGEEQTNLSAVKYIPWVGRIVESRYLGGADRFNERQAAREEREANAEVQP